jgi:WD40 repeat protein
MKTVKKINGATMHRMLKIFLIASCFNSVLFSSPFFMSVKEVPEGILWIEKEKDFGTVGADPLDEEAGNIITVMPVVRDAVSHTKLIQVHEDDPKMVSIFDAQTYEKLKVVSCEKLVAGVAFNHDETLYAIALGDSTLHIWEYATGQHLYILRAPRCTECLVSFSIDGAYLKLEYKNETFFWHITTEPQVPSPAGRNGSCCVQ